MSVASALRKMVEVGFTMEQALHAADIFERELRDGGPPRSLGAVRPLGIEYRRDVPYEQWEALRREALARDGMICRYCAAPVSSDFCCDHVVPKSRGGKSEVANLAVCCKSCNSSKKDRLLSEWRGRL